LGLTSLEKKRLQVDLTVTFKYLRVAYRKAEEGLFIRECNGGTRDNLF